MTRFDPDTVQNGHIYLLLLHFLLVRLRILAMDEMSFEV